MPKDATRGQDPRESAPLQSNEGPIGKQLPDVGVRAYVPQILEYVAMVRRLAHHQYQYSVKYLDPKTISVMVSMVPRCVDALA
jgi:hypothetical protein